MAMNMDQMQMMMARMHQQNYTNDMQLAQHFQEISNTFSSMARMEYQMYQMHTGQGQGMPQQMQGSMPQQMQGGMPRTTPGMGQAMPGMSSTMPGMGSAMPYSMR